MCIKKKEISKDFEKYKVAVRLAYINMISRLVKSGMSLDDARDEAYTYYKDDIRSVERGFISSFSVVPGFEK